VFIRIFFTSPPPASFFSFPSLLSLTTGDCSLEPSRSTDLPLAAPWTLHPLPRCRASFFDEYAPIFPIPAECSKLSFFAPCPPDLALPDVQAFLALSIYLSRRNPLLLSSFVLLSSHPPHHLLGPFESSRPRIHPFHGPFRRILDTCIFLSFPCLLLPGVNADLFIRPVSSVSFRDPTFIGLPLNALSSSGDFRAHPHCQLGRPDYTLSFTGHCSILR